MPASYRSSSYDARPPLRDRIAASGLSIAIITAIILALLWASTAPFIDMGSDSPMTTFNVGTSEQAKSTALPKQQPRTRSAERKPSSPPPVTRAAPPPPVPVPTAPGMIVLSREDFAASDIGTIAKKSGQGQGTQVADAGGGDKPVYGPSEAPGGRTLHAADWYREPTRAEMATYMPPQLREGWGVIACQTAERYHVENCREIGESPGSGIARGMRRASWQFLVRPPAVNGKPTIGAWVRIRFDIVQGITR